MKFSIVTPAFNSEKYIAETIESVISQEGDFELEYIVVDGGSSDNTVNIIKNYEQMVREGSPIIKCNRIDFKWLSEKDRGMYDAINKGFGLATGEIYAWINSDDIYLPGAFNAVQRAFQKYPEIRWLKGITSFIKESSTTIREGRCRLYDQTWIQKGIYGRDAYFIEQDSVFWRSELWKTVGGIDPKLRLAGDYYLWIRFSEITKLYGLNARLSCFRLRKGQLSTDMKAYRLECDKISTFPHISKIRYFFFIEARIPIPLFLGSFLYKLFFGEHELNLVEFAGNEIILKKKKYFLC